MASAVTIPTGTVTFAFSDVEGSTRLWAEHPEAMRVALSIHDELVNAAATEHQGYVFSTAGDSFGVAFNRPGLAADWAIAVQDRLTATSWAEGVAIRVRIGMHTGEADERAGDYFGSAVNLAARIEAAGHGGQILTSGVTASLLNREDLTELGSFHLKDVVALQPIFQVGVGEHSPLRTVDSRRGNLPRQMNGLIGRDSDLNALDATLETSVLTTLVGPGGIGKTRLALEAARRAESTMPDGVWLVELATIGNADDVARLVADVLGVRESGGRRLTEQVAAHVEGQSMLLLLDNCEHVVDGVIELIAAVLARGNSVRILATSREGLAVSGEQLVAVAPLDTNGAATELFAERARSVDPTFDLEAWREPVAEVCRRLDGVPLAIELAAARVRTLSPTDLAARLDDRFRLLTAGRRSSIERHRTLRETVAWSFDLLEPDEQLVFIRLSVLTGTFDIRAAEAVAADDRLDEFDVDDLLDALVDRSMVMAESGPFGRRFRLLETIRQFGAEKLHERSEVDAASARHAHWFATETARIGAMLEGHDEIVAVALLNEIWDNIRAAHEWACQAENIALAASFLPPILMELYWRGRSELKDWAVRVLTIPGAGDHPEAARCAGLAAGGYRWAQDREGLQVFDERFGHLDRRTVDFQWAWLDQRWDDVMDVGEEAALGLEAAGYHYLARCTRFGARSALLRRGSLAEYVEWLDGLAEEAQANGPPTIVRMSREGLAMASAISTEYGDTASRLTEASAVETPAGTITLVPMFGALDVFDRGGREKAMSMMQTGIRLLIETNSMFYAWVATAYFATMMARLERTAHVAHALGFHDGASNALREARPLVLEAESYLRAHSDASTATQVAAGAAMSHLEAMVYMANALDDVIAEHREAPDLI